MVKQHELNGILRECEFSFRKRPTETVYITKCIITPLSKRGSYFLTAGKCSECPNGCRYLARFSTIKLTKDLILQLLILGDKYHAFKLLDSLDGWEEQ